MLFIECVFLISRTEDADDFGGIALAGLLYEQDKIISYLRRPL